MTESSDRVAIVTGASRGIGRAVAEALSRSGYLVVAAARDRHAEGTVEAIAGAGGRAEVATLDVTETEAVSDLIRDVVKRLGRVDVLVANAGIARDQLLLRLKREDWDQVLATNLTGVFSCVQAVLRPMLRQRSGRIITISSVVGQMGNAGQANYAASKAGLIGFTKSVAKEVASRGITANVVAPGLIETDMTEALTGDGREQWESLVPLGRLGSPADVAHAVSFLASDGAAYITGQVVGVNGGMYM
ncbi:MAG: 3-oxoacyl-[acyl-carrier-protein] reductase [Vicinamibacterales bacterium]|jgi:3-oxoacyl-[acyl-carrier protein] reductase|nr:3-oxoacyl-[acyl-carrier-protein] reductase [Acidobacteriota bacterium]MDP7294475.1 3-oxoacyl-[acyl-carrier-protein] reductase [Vicinamibacterales bacterium]MDP7472786.1 3-oxoacyl-[acyl-carrier-protein] reductase [Vicinamibacterales bacterium]MDP7672679.1 3-oxoacyl-[acyl-carrier-protein] reductase [Vicinamibacterales bacterium]HJO38887.1 3-oxoacyl-[acyl-carrier-protein] reductase [Vicinamibacterales bacterium]|tara:strand:- start:3008 stop:3748 length:741 start_codon:yes stop_codon:yes gene_type:complete